MNPRSDVKRGLAVVGVLFLCLVLFHGGTVWGTQVFCGGDIINQEFPRRAYWLEHGFMTGWFSASMSGFPYFGDVQAGVLYPPKWLLWLGLPLERAMTWLILLHLLGGGLGFYRLARLRVSWVPALLAGVLWMCGGYLMLRLTAGVVIFIYSLAWFPWMWAEAELCGPRRPKATARLAVLGAMQFFAGAPQLVQITWVGLAIWVLSRAIWESEGRRDGLKLLGHFVVAGIATLLIALPQLAASWRYASLGAGRGESQVWDYLTNDSLHPRALWTDLAPDLFMAGNSEMFYWGSHSGFHETNGYIGIAGLILALLGLAVGWRRVGGDRRWVASCAALAVVGLVLALGRYTPIYKALYSFVPGFDLFRVPARWQLWTVGPVILLAAIGFERLLATAGEDAREEERRRVAIVGAGIVGLFLLGFALARMRTPALLGMLGLDLWHPGLPTNLREDLVDSASGALEWGLSMTVVTSIAGALLLARKLNRKVAVGLLFAGVLLDLLRFWGPFREPLPAVLDRLEIESEAVYHRIAASEFDSYFYPETPLIDELRSAQPGRFLFTDDVLDYRVDEHTREIYGERPAAFGLEGMRGYQPMILRSYLEDFRALYDLREVEIPYERQLSAFMFLPQVDDRSVLDGFNATVLLTYGSFPDRAPAREKLEGMGLRLRVQMPFGLQVWENPHAPGWAWLSRETDWPGTGSLAGEPPRDLERAPDRTALRIDVPTDGLTLHFAEVDYPGWRIRAESRDGRAVQSRGRSVSLPRGDWQVERAYHLPAITRYGVPVSAMLVLGLAVAGFWPWRRKK